MAGCGEDGVKQEPHMRTIEQTTTTTMIVTNSINKTMGDGEGGNGIMATTITPSVRGMYVTQVIVA